MTTAAEKKQQAEWRAQDDMRTLAAAKTIEADKARMGAVKQVATQQIKQLQKVVGKPAPVRSSGKK
jgi:hypothetical protein